MAKPVRASSPEELKPYLKRHVHRYQVGNQIREEITDSETGEISFKLCSIIRDLNEKGMDVIELYDLLEVYTIEQIQPHIEHECEHSNPGDINYTECGWLKYYYHKDMNIKELAEKYNVTDPDVIKYHLTNECEHDTGLDPVSL